MKEESSVAWELRKRAEQIAAGAEVLLSKTRDPQVIKRFLSNRNTDLKLTPKQQEKLDRYQYIYNQLVSGKYTDQEVLNQLMNKKLYGLGLTQAYQDLNDARDVFNTVINVNRLFELKNELQINRRMLHKAEEMNDLKTYAALEKNRIAMMALLPEEDESNVDLFEPIEIEPVFDPTLLGAERVNMKEVLEAINAKRTKKIKIDMFTELDFEDVKKENGTEAAPL